MRTPRSTAAIQASAVWPDAGREHLRDPELLERENELVIVVDMKEIVPAWFIRNADQAISVSVPAGPSGLL